MAVPFWVCDIGWVQPAATTETTTTTVNNLFITYSFQELNGDIGPADRKLSISFHPETALFPNFGVNPPACVCGVDIYASVQGLDFLDLGKNCSFPI
jgi:hypothetical protein